MAQTPAKRVTSRGDAIDHSPTSNVAAGDVVQIGTIPMVATQAIPANTLGSIASEGVFDLPKTADVFVVGDAVYWNPAGTDLGLLTGAADNATGNLAGTCVMNAGATATHVRTKLTAAKRTATIANSVLADDITGTDSSLGIEGRAGNAATNGGIVAIAGGAGHTDKDGGAVTIAGGESGTGNTTNGGAVAIVGGAATNATTGDGGAVTIAGGAGSILANTGGAVTILSGAGDTTNGTAGAVILDSSGTGLTKGAVTIATNAASLTLGKMPRVPCAIVAANGGNQDTAGVLAEGVNIISGSDNAKGVVLPSCVNGAQCIVVNLVTDNSLLIYPPSGKQVNKKGANNAINVAANTVGIYVSEGTNAWYGLHAATDVA